jgi:hypothetical protein
MESRTAQHQCLVIVAGLVWLALLFAGFGALLHEAYQAVPPAALVASFPKNSPLALDPKQPTLLLFAHPQCPCTRATFEELDQLRAQTNDGLAVTIVFTLPPHTPPGWEKGALLTAAEKMPRIRIVLDQGGVLAQAFHVIGSGHVLVYAPTGRLLFSGGITPSRGHEGDSPGRDAIVELVRGEPASAVIQKPVFGCALL